MQPFSRYNVPTVIALLEASLQGRSDNFRAVIDNMKDDEHQGVDQAMSTS